MSSKATMYPLVKQYHKSGLSISSFCEKNKLAVSTFRYWVQQYNKREKSIKTSSFISIEATPSVSPCVEIFYPNKVCIKVASTTNLSFLKELINLC